MSFWYTSLADQLRWEHYNRLIEIVQPSPADWRNLTAVSDLVSKNEQVY